VSNKQWIKRTIAC